MGDVTEELLEVEQHEMSSDTPEREDVERYVSQFEDVDELWDELDSRGHTDGNSRLEDILEGRSLDCIGRATVMAVFSDMYGPELDFTVQYDTFGPNKMPLMPSGSHITPEKDQKPYDWRFGFDRSEEFDLDEIPSLYALDMAAQHYGDGDIEMDEDYLAEEVGGFRRERDSYFVKRQDQARKVDSAVARFKALTG